jgi:general secretion pathway protein G
MGQTRTRSQDREAPAGARARSARALCGAALLCGLLVGPTGCGYIALGSAQQIRTAKIQLKSLGEAIAAFRVDMGRLPTAEEWPTVLWAKPEGADAAFANYRDGGYLSPPLGKDPWGCDYVYEPGEPDENGKVTQFRLSSFGPNRQDDSGEGDDIVYPPPVAENAATGG